MKTPAQKVIYSLLTLILLLSIGSGVVATNGNRTELINPELDNELSEETLKIIPIEDTDRDGNTHNYQGAQANYSAQAGDSGGLVFVYTNLGPIWAGVQSGGGAGYLSVFARATDVVSSLNVSVN